MDVRRLESLMELVLEVLVRIERKERHMANVIDKLETDVADLTAKVGTLIASGGALNAADTARLEAVATKVEALAADVAAATPPA